MTNQMMSISRNSRCISYDANILGLVPCLVEETVKEMFRLVMELATEDEIKKAEEYVLKRGLSTLLLIGMDQGRYDGMKHQMQQNMALGMNPKYICKD